MKEGVFETAQEEDWIKAEWCVSFATFHL